MKIAIDWQAPVQLTRHKRIIVDEYDLPESIDALPGVYFFSRRWGSDYVPFYIGETQNLRARLRAHLKSRQIADVLRGMKADDERIKSGTRHFHFGYLRRGRGQITSSCLGVVQLYLIRQAVEQNIPILNKQLKTFRTHTLAFEGDRRGRGIYPRTQIVEA